MIYCSIDIETSGVDLQNDQILEVGAVIEDTEKQLSFDEIPKFNAIINHKRLTGSVFGLNMNVRIIEILKNIPRNSETFEKLDYIRKHNIVDLETLGLSFYTFLSSNGIKETEHRDVKIIVAGKNFGSFDKNFLEKIPSFTKYIKFGHRSIDPANFYIDFSSDTEIPSLDECMKRAEIRDTATHVALQDAWDVVRVLRKKY